MTRLTRKEKSLTAAMVMLIIVLIAMSLASCRSAARHLQLSEYHKTQAIKKGAEVKTDVKTFHFKSPEIRFETTLEPVWLDGAPIPMWKDTLVYTDLKTGATVKAKIKQATNCPDSCNQIETVYLQADVPEQDLEEEVPCETEIRAGYTVWEMVILSIASLAVGAVLGRIFWK